jgi:ABC-type transport system substrate-binding protein
MHIWKDYRSDNPAGAQWEDNPHNEMPMGNGPFIVKDYKREQFTIMERNEDYFRGYPYLDSLIWNVIPDDTAALLAMENGEIDSMSALHPFPLQEIDRVNSLPDFTVNGYPYTTSWRLRRNYTPESWATWPWLANNQVMYALEHAIDKETIARDLLNGVTSPTSTSISWIVPAFAGDLNNAADGYTGPFAIEKREFNPDKARDLLDAAGWMLNADGVREKDGVEIKGFEIVYYDYATTEAEAIQKYWEDIGVFMDPVPIEPATFFQGVEYSEFGLNTVELGGPWPFSLNTMGGGPLPDAVLPAVQSRLPWGPGWDRATDNFGFYANDRVDELAELIQSTTDPVIRKESMDEIQYIQHEEVWAIMLYNNWKVEAWNNDFAGFNANLPVAWYGGYYRGNQTMSNEADGVYWVRGEDQKTTTVPEILDLRVMAAFLLFMFFGLFYQKRRKVYIE